MLDGAGKGDRQVPGEEEMSGASKGRARSRRRFVGGGGTCSPDVSCCGSEGMNPLSMSSHLPQIK